MSERCLDCLAASDGPPDDRDIMFSGSPGTSKEERAEMVMVLLEYERTARYTMTPVEDARLWEGFASTRPDCACGGTGYLIQSEEA